MAFEFQTVRYAFERAGTAALYQHRGIGYVEFTDTGEQLLGRGIETAARCECGTGFGYFDAHSDEHVNRRFGDHRRHLRIESFV